MKKTSSTKDNYFITMSEIEQEFLPESYKRKIESEDTEEQYIIGTSSLSDIICSMREQIRK